MNLDWAFWAGGALLSAFGLALLLWALLWDRSKGRRRCPKCWYNMSGTPGSLTCSECRKTVKRERKFFKTRRRWRWACASILVFGIAAAVSRAQNVHRSGLQALLPTTALIALEPSLPTIPEVNLYALRGRSGLSRNEVMRFELAKDLHARLNADGMWQWQWNILIDRCLNGDAEHRPPSFEWSSRYAQMLNLAKSNQRLNGERLDRAQRQAIVATIHTRKRWAANVPIYRELRADFAIPPSRNLFATEYIARPRTEGAKEIRFIQSGGVCGGTGGGSVLYWDEPMKPIGIAALDGAPLAFDVTNKDAPKASSTIFAPIEIVRNADDIVHPIGSEAANAEITASLRYSLQYTATASLSLDLSSIKTTLERLGNVTLAIVIDVLDAKHASVGHGEAWWSSGRTNFGPSWRSFPRDQNGFGPIIPLIGDLHRMGVQGEDLDHWCIRIRGSPEVALRNFDCDQYWSGEIYLPIDRSGGNQPPQ